MHERRRNWCLIFISLLPWRCSSDLIYTSPSNETRRIPIYSFLPWHEHFSISTKPLQNNVIVQLDAAPDIFNHCDPSAYTPQGLQTLSQYLGIPDEPSSSVIAFSYNSFTDCFPTDAAIKYSFTQYQKLARLIQNLGAIGYLVTNDRMFSDRKFNTALGEDHSKGIIDGERVDNSIFGADIYQEYSEVLHNDLIITGYYLSIVNISDTNNPLDAIDATEGVYGIAWGWISVICSAGLYNSLFMLYKYHLLKKRKHKSYLNLVSMTMVMLAFTDLLRVIESYLNAVGE